MTRSKVWVLWIMVLFGLVMSFFGLGVSLGYAPFLRSPGVEFLIAIQKAANSPATARVLRDEIRRYAEDAQGAETAARTAAASITAIGVLFSVFFFVVSVFAYARLSDIDERLRKADNLSAEIATRHKSGADALKSRFESLQHQIPDPLRVGSKAGLPFDVWEAAEVEEWDFKALVAQLAGQQVDPKNLWALGNFFYLKGDFGKSILRYHTAIETEPRDRDKAKYQYSLGRALLHLIQAEDRKNKRLQLCERGIDAFNECRLGEPSYAAFASYYLAWLHDELGRLTSKPAEFEKAIELLETAIKNGTPTLIVEAKFNKACALFQLNRRQQAIDVLVEIKDHTGIRERVQSDSDVSDLYDAVYPLKT